MTELEVCSKMQKLLDISNSRIIIYEEDIPEAEIISWDDGVLAETEESIKTSIKNNNKEIDHLTKCKHKGCIELKKNWKDGGVWKRYTNRESMLTGGKPLI